MKSKQDNSAKSARRFAAKTAAIGAAIALVGYYSKPVAADTYTWANSGDGNWSTGFSPSEPPSDFGTQLVFIPGNYTSTNDIGAFNFGSLTFNNSPDTNLITVAGFNTLTLGGTAPAITDNGGSAAIVGQIATADGTQITNNGGGTLTLNSMIFASNASTSITNTGAGTVTLTDAAANYGTNSTINLANTGTGLFQIGNLGAVSGIINTGVTGTINITAGAVTFFGNTGGDLFTNGMVLNIAAGASFNFANNGEVFGGLTGSGNVIMGTAGLTFAESGNRSYNGSISGTGGVAQDTASVLTLGGSNLYSGTTTIEAGGTIRAAAANVFSPNSLVNIVAGAGTFDPGGFNQTIVGLTGGIGDVIPVISGTLTLTPAAGTTDLFYGSMAGAGNLTVNGAGIQTILGTNALTGITSVTGGTLRESYAGLSSSSSVVIGSAGTLDTSVATSVTSTVPWSGTGTLVKSGLGTLSFAASNPNFNLSNLVVNAGGITLNFATDNGSQIGSNPALTLGSATLAVVGSATAVSAQNFNGLNLTGGGEIDLTAGTGKTASMNIGAISRNIGSGGTINFKPASSTATITTTTTNTAGIGIIGGYAVYNSSGWAVVASNGSIGTLTAYNTNSWATTTHTDVTAALTAPAAGSTYDVRFNTSAAETVTLSGSNTITDGGILVTPATTTKTSTITGSTNAATSALNVPPNQDLIVNEMNATGPLTISAIILDNPGTASTQTGLNISGKTITNVATAGLYIGEYLSSSADIPTSDNAHIVSINSPTSITISSAATPTTDSNGSVTFQQNTNLVKSGPGTLTLTRANTFAGVIDLNAGTLTVTAVTNLGSNSSTGSSAVYFNGGTLQANGSLAAVSAVQPYIIGPAGGTINVAPTFTVSKEGNSFFGSGPLTVTSTGTGIFGVGSNASTYNGPVTVNGGIFRFTSNQFASAAGVTINTGGQYQIEDDGVASWNFAAGTPLTLNGTGPAGYTYPGAMALTIQSNDGNPVSTFTNPVVLQTSSTVGVYSTSLHVASLILSGTVSGPGTLTVTGDPNYGGNTTVSFANTYTGGTVVANGGTLFVNNTAGSGTGTGAVTVALGGTLAGTGTIIAPVSVNAGGTIFAGLTNDTTSKVASVLTLGSGSSLQGTTELDITGGPVLSSTVGLSDNIVFGSTTTPGVANFGGGLTVTSPNAVAFSAGMSFDLFTFGSNPGSSTFSSYNLPALSPGLSWNTNALGTTGMLSVVNSAANLTFNNTGGTGDGTTFDTVQQNFNNGTSVINFNPGDNVTFDDTTPNNQYTVKINTQVQPGSVTVNNSNGNYLFTGTGSIIGQTGLIKNGTGTLTLSTSNTYTGDTVVNAGSLVLTATGKIVGNLIVNSGASLTIGANTPGSGIAVRTIGTLTVNSATASLTPVAAHTDRTLLVTTGLSITGTGQLDLGNNDLDVQNGNLSQITAAVATGYNASGTLWTGPGISSTSAASDTSHLTALGVLINNNGAGAAIYGTGTGTLGSFDGINPGLNDVLVKYTYYGDANLDGAVDGSDYSLIDHGFASNGALTGWQNGDFNYDGKIDGSDYTLIDNAFNTQGASLGSNPAAIIASSAAQFAGGSSAVPEPATLGLLGLGAIGALTRRRRQNALQQ